MENEDKLYCPLCGGSHLTANKQGFGAGKAITGAILAGGVGLLAGFIGSNKVQITCLQCNAKLKPGQLKLKPLTEEEKQPYYNLLAIKEKQDKEAEKPMSIGTKLLLIIFILLALFTMMFTCN